MTEDEKSEYRWEPPMPWERLFLAAVVLFIFLPCLGLDLLGPVIGFVLALGLVVLLWAGAHWRTQKDRRKWAKRREGIDVTLLEPDVLNRRLDDLEAQHREHRHSRSHRVESDEYASMDPEGAAITEELRRKYDPEQAAFSLLDELCPAYLDASAEERVSVRAAVKDRDWMLNALMAYVHRAAKRIRWTGDREWLWYGLAALSIEDCSQDYRDVLVALRKLYGTAMRAGIAPKPDFRAIARLSSDQRPRGGSTSMRDLLFDDRE